MSILLVFTVTMLAAGVAGHGYLMDPPARNSAWRTYPELLPNYVDTQLNCGGMANQWEQQDGKCGVCGDPYQGPYEHEAGGIYAKPDRKVTQCYNKVDDVIDIHVIITAHHQGYFKFRLCEHNDMATRVSESCFEDGILLTEYETGKTVFSITNNVQWDYYYQLNMPRDVNCTQCILRWEYTTGNRWGCDETEYCTSEIDRQEWLDNCCGLGKGKEQEWFVNCADVAILDDCAVTMTSPAPTRPPGPNNCGRRRLRR